ncbi:DNA-binding response regulator [Neiella marina]|uniref:DNA-binding response regulator n=1 Tax=Neiella marina TaxID=508461 RepID=A0A8J2XMK3_9GAMM|nr:response regulator [Neiella marina]GGA65019.1 DNA-binding response regulator [Neiella marina]
MTAPATDSLLIIDDDQTFAELLQRRLRRHGFVTDVAFDAATALGKAQQLKPSHILLDMKLGDDSGLQLLPNLRQLVPHARVVLLTGYASVTTAVQAMKLGADDYLSKPVDSAALLAALTGQNAVEPAVVDETMSPERAEWEHIQRVLALHDGNVSAAARAMNMHRRTLQRKLQKRPVKQ